VSDPKIHPKGGGPTRNTTLPDDPAGRKEYPIATGFLDYFPDAIAAVAHLSWRGNQQHNPGEETYWNRSKSSDEPDTAMRHFLQRGTLDTDGVRHTAKACWRMLAVLQKEIEAEQNTAAPKSIAPVPVVFQCVGCGRLIRNVGGLWLNDNGGKRHTCGRE
jgi:hypothetical protein